MRLRRAVLPVAALFLALTGHLAGADWLLKTGSGFPAAISVNRERILVFATNDVIELSPEGALRGAKAYESAGDEFQIERIVKVRDGFLACGFWSAAHQCNPAIVRVSEAGEVRWARVVVDADCNDGMPVAAEASGGDIVMATRIGQAMLMVRFTASGETKWSRVFDRTGPEKIKSLVATRDGGVLTIAIGLAQFAALTLVDASGKVVWTRLLGSGDAGYGFYDAVELPGGGFIAAGRLRTISTNDRDGWLLRISAGGDVLWQKALGGDGEDGLFAVVRTGTNEFAAVGGTTSTGAGDADTWIVRFTADGLITSEVTVGEPGNDGPLNEGRSVAAGSDDGEVVFASPSDSPGALLLVGRIQSASPACAFTHAVRTRERVSTATQKEAAFEFRDAAPAIRPVVVRPLDYRTKVTNVCQWKGTPGPSAPRTIAVEPPDEETLFADGIAKLLLERKFEELDRTAAAARKARLTFDSGGSKLFAFYQALGRHSSLVALGDEAHRRLLEEWRTATHSATSGIALASEYSAAAERVRGDGFFNSILAEDAETYHRFTTRALALLVEAESAGSCDAPCYHLQIRTGQIGGWSEELKKLQAIDPTYWEALEPATMFLGENWGGHPGDIDRFIESYSTATKKALGDAVYALHFADWLFGVMDEGSLTPFPDWARMRAGFADFQRLFPKSRLNAQRFAAAAYRVARDRDAARALFKTGFLDRPDRNVWRDRLEFERVKDWALRAPVEPFASKISAAAGGRVPRDVPELVGRAKGSSADWMHAFVVQTGTGPFAIISAHAGDPKRWTLYPDMPAFAVALHPLKIRTAPVVNGDRLFIIACSGERKNCAPRITQFRAYATSIGFGPFTPIVGSPIQWKPLAGAPILDDDGALAGVVLPSVEGETPEALPIQFILNGSNAPSPR